MARKSVCSPSFIETDVDSNDDAQEFEAFEDDFDDDDRYVPIVLEPCILTHFLLK